MDRRAIVATHHKTGTAWMATTFNAICTRLDIPMVKFSRKVREVAGAAPPVVFLDNHSAWFAPALAKLRRPDDRTFHLIRDPRDVVISAMHYHRTAKEPWLHIAHEAFEGQTYQQRINSFADDSARYMFEMDNSSGRVTKAMGRWDYARPESFECKYEDLIRDTEAELFSRALEHLGFEGQELKAGQRHFARHSLFSGKARRVGKSTHIRSGSTGQWRDVFDRRLGEAFVERFGNVLVRLGYETDDSWVEILPAVAKGKSAA